MSRCDAITSEQLIAWWHGDLEGELLDRVEEHLLSCETCAEDAARIERVTEALSAIGDEARPPVITPEDLARLEATAEVRIHHARTGDEVHERVDSEVVVLRLAADLSGVERLDVELRGPDDGVYFALSNVPFTPGEIIIACHRHIALSTPIVRMRFYGVDGSGRREVARVTLFNE